KLVKLAPRRADPREIFAQTLADNDLFVEDWEYLPFTIHSYEYAGKEPFLAAVVGVADELNKRPMDGTLTIVPAPDWATTARRAQRDVIAALTTRLSGRRRLGDFYASTPLPTPTMLSSNDQTALRQAVFAVSAQVAPGEEMSR